ncbi:MAG: membrane protein [Planctomycetota bacterium]|nr:MAG: membrane protein [Planctomycetota bacterium]
MAAMSDDVPGRPESARLVCGAGEGDGGSVREGRGAAASHAGLPAAPPGGPAAEPEALDDVEVPASPPGTADAGGAARLRAVPPLGRPVRAGVFATYKERICHLSERLVRAQRPIRILNAIKWGPEVFAELRASNYKRLPAVDAEYYRRIPLEFEPEAKLEELAAIGRDIERHLGKDDPIGAILWRNCAEYQQVVRMLAARGTPEFYRHARELYGTPKETFYDGKTTLRGLGLMIYEIFSGLDDTKLGITYPRTLSAEQAVARLNERFRAYFHDDQVRVQLDDGIVSDAAAGADYLKIKQGVQFSERDLQILEVHEGWAHIGTSLSGQNQRVATWLSKGPPCTTPVQEGLAVLLEVVTFVSLPVRARKLNYRVIAIDKAEDGADLLDIIEFYRIEGFSEAECLLNAQRVFRGGVVSGGAPFTKDVSYCKGFVQLYNWLRTCIRLGRPELIPFLFVGKVTLEDVPVLYDAARHGVVDPPKYIPPPFQDLNGLAVWMAFSNFFNRIQLSRVVERLRPSITAPPWDPSETWLRPRLAEERPQPGGEPLAP